MGVQEHSVVHPRSSDPVILLVRGSSTALYCIELVVRVEGPAPPKHGGTYDYTRLVKYCTSYSTVKWDDEGADHLPSEG